MSLKFLGGEKCRSIFIILSGRDKGIDMQIQGKFHTFKEFGAGRVLGEFECLSGIPEYSITILTITKCIFWVIPSAMYLRWMKRDGDALFLRTQKLLICSHY
jgi:CRP-like cAMP-binding protein